MDLFIRRLSCGSVETKTYRKKHFRPQYLHFLSSHPLSTKLGIYRGEAERHALNCSRESDYNHEMQIVETNLIARGYPGYALCRPRYDAHKRVSRLQKLADRAILPASSNKVFNDGILVFKAPFSPWLRHLRLQREYQRLKCSLQNRDASMLRDTRMVIAHPVVQNAFLETYRFNFPC